MSLVPSRVHVVHNTAAMRFEALVEGQLCVCDCRLLPHPARRTLMVFTHTGVPAGLAVRGIASALVQQALVWAREQGYAVQPKCSYVAAWMHRHPQTLDLLAD